MSLNLFIIGPSGCGKSTQAKLIAEKYGLKHFSTGTLLREEMASASLLGLDAKSYMDSGNLVPDDIVYALLVSNLQKIDNCDFIIDGFPRLLNQGQYIEKYLANKGSPLSLVIHLDVTAEEIHARRAQMQDAFQDKDRTDNTPEAIASRQKFYDDNNGPIMGYFSASGKLLRVNGNRPINPIFEDICLAVDKLSPCPVKGRGKGKGLVINDIQEKDEEIEILDEETSKRVAASMKDFKKGRFVTLKTSKEIEDFFNKLK